MRHSYGYWASKENPKNITVYENIIALGSSIEEAIFERRMIYLWEKYKHNGEIFIIPRRFAFPVGMTLYQFRKLVKKWQNLQILKTESRGWPLKKWYILNEEKLAKHLDSIQRKGRKLQVTETNKISYRNQQDKVTETNKIYNKKKIRKKIYANSASRKVGKRYSLLSDKTHKMSFFEKAATHFIKIVVKTYKMPVENYRLKKWVSEIEQLHTRDKISKKEIKDIIKWYAHHIKDQFVPKIHRADQIRKKWISLRIAMHIQQIKSGEREAEEGDGCIVTEEKRGDETISTIKYPDGYFD